MRALPRVVSFAVLAVVLTACTGSSSKEPGASGTAATAPAGGSSSAGPSGSVASGDPQAVFDSLAADAPAAPHPDGAAAFQVALAEHGADYSTCLTSATGKTSCKKPASLGTRDLKAVINVEIVLDASGSMKESVGGRTKIDVAKESIALFVSQLPNNAKVSVRTFGNGADEPKAVSCASSRLVVPFQPANAGKVRDALGRTKVQGYTPLAGALGKAKADFASRPATANSNFVYVVSDGEETCDGDPVAAAKALTAAEIDVQVNVIGFAVDSKAAAQLKAAASAGGGVYAPAGDDKALDRAFTQTGDWAAWTKYYNCRYSEINAAAAKTQVSAHAMQSCFIYTAAGELKAIGPACDEQSVALVAAIQRRTDALTEQAKALPAEQSSAVMELITKDDDAMRRTESDADADCRDRARQRYLASLGAGVEESEKSIKTAAAQRAAALAQLDGLRDQLGLTQAGG